MITNTLLLLLKDRSPENIEKAREVLLSMEGNIPHIQRLRVESDLRHGPSSYDLLLAVQYEHMDDFDAYLVHPVHVEVSRYIASVVEKSASVCYES